MQRSRFIGRRWLAAVALGSAGACSFPSYEVPPEGRYLPKSCSDRRLGDGESDVDCGGPCTPCPIGERCLVAGDCTTGVCNGSLCAPPSCSDGVQNGSETDIDCGESCAPTRCSSGAQCRVGEDCLSRVCGEDERCARVACNDGVLNGAETATDCGGPTCPACALGASCAIDEDCESRICQGAKCVGPGCRDGMMDNSESDIDCGGANCGPCDEGKKCAVASDCVSGACASDQRCAPPSCEDSVVNQDETDTDCGGTICSACSTGASCLGGSDCESTVCMMGECQAPSCEDESRNGDEVGVDCGGACAACPAGTPCTDAADCSSSVCSVTCQPPSCTDLTQNGDESDVDCGGSCMPCGLGEACNGSQDCATLACDGTCRPPQHASVGFDDLNDNTNKPKPKIRITNDSSESVPLRELTARYYYTRDPAGEESFEVYWATGNTGAIVKSRAFSSLSPSKPTADRYLEIGFDSDAALGPGQEFQAHVAFFISPGFPKFNQTNDYSYTGRSSVSESSKVTVYRSGNLVWGSPP